MKQIEKFRASFRCALLVLMLLPLLLYAEGVRAPNIILVMMDDMGFSDIGCYGGEIHTPHIDALAQNGVRFSQFYNAARVAPPPGHR